MLSNQDIDRLMVQERLVERGSNVDVFSRTVNRKQEELLTSEGYAY